MINTEELIEIRRALHQIPELGFQEVKTQQFLLQYISRLPHDYLSLQKWETGLFVKIEGTSPSKTIAYRADIDGLPIEEETSYAFKSQHKGNMHACGHDLHMTIALGVLCYYTHNRPTNNLLFIFQPAEEGPGGALPMLQSDYLKANKPDMIVGLHIAPEYPVGTIATKKGLLFANTSELFIDFVGVGGHAAFPHKANDMIVAASHFVTQIQSIVSRNVDPLDAAVITIGKLESGTKQNVIAERARLEGTIRTLSKQSMSNVKARIEAMLSGFEVSFNCKTELDYGSNYMQVYNNYELTQEFMEFAEGDKEIEFYQCKEAMTGEDFGYFLNEVPGFMFWLGVDSKHGLHSSKLEPDEAAIEKACSFLIRYLNWKQTN
jgi:N-acetyldiaminopimelate deacetylase